MYNHTLTSTIMEALMKAHGLKEEDCSMEITRCHLEEISRCLCEKWRSLPPYLEMEAIVVGGIERQFSDEDDRRRSFFLKWKSKKGSGATYKKLVASLLAISCREDAEKVCGFVQRLSKSCFRQDERALLHSESREQGAESNGAMGSSGDSVADKHDTDTPKAPTTSAAENEFSNLDPDTRDDLELQLEKNLTDILKQYASYVSFIRTALQEKGITGEELRSHLLNEPVFTDSERNQQLKLFSSKTNKLQKTFSVNDIFEILSTECCSFLEYGVIESIAKHYGIGKGQGYSDQLHDYLERHKIKEFISINPALVGKMTDDSEKLILKFDISTTARLVRVVNLKKTVARVLGLKASALQLLDIKDGCVEVTFLIPKLVAQEIFSNKSIDEKIIRELRDVGSVMWVKCMDVVLLEDKPWPHKETHLHPAALQHSSQLQQQPHSNYDPNPDEELPNIMSGLRLREASTAISNLQTKMQEVFVSKEYNKANQTPLQSERRQGRPIYCYLQPVKESPVDSQEPCILSPESNLSLSSSSLLAPPAIRQQFSASSLDSGVGNARNSKRTSLEHTNTDMGHYNSNSSLLNRTGRGQPLFHVGSYVKDNLSILIPPTITETEEPKKGRNRLSVDEKAFSQLLQAATIVVSSAHPSSLDKDGVQNKFLKNSVKHYKRRMSLSDNPCNRSQCAKMRKVSAAPVLQTTTSSGLPDEMQHRKRSKLDCIICERRRKVSQNNIKKVHNLKQDKMWRQKRKSRVLVNTPMISQQRTTLSEVLMIYRPGELPFTESVVPKISELKKPTALPGGVCSTERIKSLTLADLDGETIRTLVDKNTSKFVRLTNWSCLYSYLISKGLLDPHMREYMISSDSQLLKGNKFFGEYLPAQGGVGYLKLLACLQEEEEHSGHKELVDTLKNELKRLK